jgi:hypothetical protein
MTLAWRIRTKIVFLRIYLSKSMLSLPNATAPKDSPKSRRATS